VYSPLAGARASLVAGDPDRIWIVDERNRLSALHTATGELFQIAQLPKDAKPATLLVTRDHVYLPDVANGKLYVLDVKAEQLSPAIAMPFVRLATAFAASPDGRLWIGTDGFGLLSYEAASRRENVIDVGRSRISALGVDAIGRVWIGPRGRDGLEIYDPLNGKLIEVGLPRQGTVTAFSVDAQTRMWIGTDAGEIFAIRNSRLDASAQNKGRVDEFASDADGRVWWVSRSAAEVVSGPADGSLEPSHAPTGSSSPMFDAFGRAWINDRASGSFFVTLPGGGR
jgi:ligand-binding sensor domain-containing protein